MTWALAYYISVFLAASFLIFTQWWEMRKNPLATLTLKELCVGIFLAVCPIINTVVGFIGWAITFSDVFKDIIVMGPRK